MPSVYACNYFEPYQPHCRLRQFKHCRSVSSAEATHRATVRIVCFRVLFIWITGFFTVIFSCLFHLFKKTHFNWSVIFKGMNFNRGTCLCLLIQCWFVCRWLEQLRCVSGRLLWYSTVTQSRNVSLLKLLLYRRNTSLSSWSLVAIAGNRL